jgi:hypothetical protein
VINLGPKLLMLQAHSIHIQNVANSQQVTVVLHSLHCPASFSFIIKYLYVVFDSSVCILHSRHWILGLLASVIGVARFPSELFFLSWIYAAKLLTTRILHNGCK